MTTRSCPRCDRDGLYQTGAFWNCSNCGYAITQSALIIDEAPSWPAGKPRHDRRRRQSHGRGKEAA
jgi:hypothetical protein